MKIRIIIFMAVALLIAAGANAGILFGDNLNIASFNVDKRDTHGYLNIAHVMLKSCASNNSKIQTLQGKSVSNTLNAKIGRELVKVTNGNIKGTVYVADKAGYILLSGVVVSTDTGLSTTSDAAGHYELTAPLGTYTINASKNGYTSPDYLTVSVDGSENSKLDIYMSPNNANTIKIYGKVTYEVTNLPAADIMVSVDASHKAVTNNKGYYIIPVETEGTYSITISGGTIATAVKDGVKVNSGVSVNVNISANYASGWCGLNY